MLVDKLLQPPLQGCDTRHVTLLVLQQVYVATVQPRLIGMEHLEVMS